MTAGPELAALIAAHGLAVLLPLAVIEGPVVTLAAGAMASLGLVAPGPALACLIIADLLGDLLIYAGGRGLFRRIGRTRRGRLVPLMRAMRQRAGRLLLAGKLTHAAGFAVIAAAGAARVPPGRFIAFSLLGAVPKSAALFALGYGFAQAQDRIAHGLGWGSALLAAGLVVAALPFLPRGRRTTAADR